MKKFNTRKKMKISIFRSKYLIELASMVLKPKYVGNRFVKIICLYKIA